MIPNPKRKLANRPPGPNSKDLGLKAPGGGKGDAPRNCFSNEFKNNFDKAFSHSTPAEGFERVGNKQIKKY